MSDFILNTLNKTLLKAKNGIDNAKKDLEEMTKKDNTSSNS